MTGGVTEKIRSVIERLASLLDLSDVNSHVLIWSLPIAMLLIFTLATVGFGIVAGADAQLSENVTYSEHDKNISNLPSNVSDQYSDDNTFDAVEKPVVLGVTYFAVGLAKAGLTLGYEYPILAIWADYALEPIFYLLAFAAIYCYLVLIRRTLTNA